MSKLRIHNFSISLDGYGAGPDQDLEHPVGHGGMVLHEWALRTNRLGDEDVHRTYREIDGLTTLEGRDVDQTSLDADMITLGDTGIGASIMGRNMFGPVRGPWPNDDWTGWWGEDPPYHHDVFVLTQYPRAPIPMKGGTTFHFVADGIEAALDRAVASAGGSDVRLYGGVSTIQQYLRAGLVDEMHLAVVPVLLGAGLRLFADELEGAQRAFRCVEFVKSAEVAHARFARE